MNHSNPLAVPDTQPPPRHARKRPWGLWVALAVLVAGGFWWQHHNAAGASAGGRDPSRRPLPQVAVEPVRRAAAPLVLPAIGAVEATASVSVRALVGGQLERVSFRQGQPVKRGQLLFTIDARPLRAALEQARAALARDRATAANNRAQAIRYAGLVSQGFVSREQAEQYRTTAATAEANVAADLAALENAQVQLGYASVRSPIDGVAGALLVTAGNLVRANDTNPLVVINQVKPIYVNFSVPEDQLGRIRAFQARHPLSVEARLHGDPKPANGQLIFLDNAVDPTTGTIKLRGSFPNTDGRLVPGAYVDVNLTLDTQADAIVAPAQAVLVGQAGSYAYVVTGDDQVEVRPVQADRTLGALTVIKSGLQPGDRVVTDGQMQLAPGMKVKVARARPDAAAGAAGDRAPETGGSQAPGAAPGRRHHGPPAGSAQGTAP